MNPIIGKWQQPAGQPYPGLWFLFMDDGTFTAEYADMGIVSSGTYQVAGEMIEINQTAHTFGIVGLFKGRFAVEGDTLNIALGNPGEEAPADLAKARVYLKK